MTTMTATATATAESEARARQEAERAAQEGCRAMTSREVYHCVSSLVSDLASGYGEAHGDLGELCEEAMELCTPTQDHESAALDEGIEVREDPDGIGWQYSTKTDRDDYAKKLANYQVAKDRGADEDELEDMEPSDPWQELDSADDEASAWREACEEEGIDPHESEIFEHWIVSNWLARRLEERGERTGTLAGLTIWGRATSGQAIYMDGVIREIWAETQRKEKGGAAA